MQGLDGTTSPLGRPLTTPVPPSDVSQQSSDSETTGAKDENGQEISCVVCNDKSSGKHYGQFTCEGKPQKPFSYCIHQMEEKIF